MNKLIIVKKVNGAVSANWANGWHRTMASTDDGELSPMAMEVREGQKKIDLARALKNRVYVLVKQVRPDETTFRQAVRDMGLAMEDVKKDVTGSVDENTRDLLQQQVNRAQEKALQRLMEINPSLSSISQVEDIEGNPPQRQVPSATRSPDMEVSQGSGDASGFETVEGTGAEDPRQNKDRSEKVAVAPKECPGPLRNLPTIDGGSRNPVPSTSQQTNGVD